MKSRFQTAVFAVAMVKRFRPIIVATAALAAILAVVTSNAAAQERLKIIYSQFTMTNSATWFAREAGLFERHGLNAELIYVDSAPGGAGAHGRRRAARHHVRRLGGRSLPERPRPGHARRLVQLEFISTDHPPRDPPPRRSARQESSVSAGSAPPPTGRCA